MSRGGKSSHGGRGRGQSNKGANATNREWGGKSTKGKHRSDHRDSLFDEPSRKFCRTIFEDMKDVRKQEIAIAAFKEREVLCPICGKRIEDMESAITDKQTGEPAHFDCILSAITANEHLSDDESIAYVGQGKFAVLRYETVGISKTFHIERKIEWEAHSVDIPWRQEISTLYSQVL